MFWNNKRSESTIDWQYLRAALNVTEQCFLRMFSWWMHRFWSVTIRNWLAVKTANSCLCLSQWRSQPGIREGGKIFDFRRATAFHIWNTASQSTKNDWIFQNIWGAWPPGSAYVLSCICTMNRALKELPCVFSAFWFQKVLLLVFWSTWCKVYPRAVSHLNGCYIPGFCSII